MSQRLFLGHQILLSRFYSMATYKFYLFDYATSEETYVILRLAENKKTFKFYTDLKIQPKYWNSSTGEARRTYRGYSTFNDLLKERYRVLKELHEELKKSGNFSPETLRQRFYETIGKNEKEVAQQSFVSLTDFAENYIQSVESVKKKNTLIHNRQTWRLLKEFETVKRRTITFERVNLDFYNDFIEFLTTYKRFAPNTIGKHIRTTKLFLNEATERGVNTKLDFKSKRFKALTEKVETIYLTEDEIQHIYEFDFKRKALEQTRDLFIIGCFTGLRFSDFSQLKQDNISSDEIRIKTQKTGDFIVIPLHPTVKKILAKYAHTLKGLPRPVSNQRMNDDLKEIGQQAGLNEKILMNKTKGGLRVQQTVFKYELITTHTARRSFATNLYLQGFPAISIMKITGHKTEKAFMSYIRISQEENSKLLQMHWSKNTKLKVI